MDGPPGLPVLVTSGPTGRVATIANVQRAIGVTFFVLLVLSLVVPLLIAFSIAKNLPPGKPPGDDPAFLPLMLVTCLGIISLAFTLLFVNHFLSRYIARRLGRAEVFFDRIVLYKGEKTIEVPWSQVKRLAVSSPDFVQIVRGFRRSPLLAIPTPDAATQRSIVQLWTSHREGGVAAPELSGRGQTGGLLLVAEGSPAWKRSRRRLRIALGLVYVGVMAYVGLVRMRVIASPTFTFFIMWLPNGLVELLFTVVPIAIYVSMRDRLMEHAQKRIGRAEIFERAIIFYQGDRQTALLWELIGGFDDGAIDVLEVQLKGAPSLHFPIPTPDEALRVRILALLSEHGIPRVDPTAVVS